MEEKIWMVSLECKFDTGYYLAGMTIDETVTAEDEEHAMSMVLKLHNLYRSDVSVNMVREFAEDNLHNYE